MVIENTKVRSTGINGALRFQDNVGQDLFIIGATTNMPFGSYYRTNTTVTTALTITAAHSGNLILCGTDNVVFTLPTAGLAGYSFTIQNTASDGGALLVVKTAATSDVIMGLGITVTTDCAISNTKATQRFGDSVGLMSSGSVTWLCSSVVGTWALSATS